MNLAKNLKLTIDLVDEGQKEWIKLVLEDDLNLIEARVDYLLTPYTTNDRSYHVREGIVIAMRRLVSQAVVQGMIFAYPGTPLMWSTPRSKENSSTTSLTELELL